MSRARKGSKLVANWNVNLVDIAETRKKMAPQVGLEPTTLRLTAGCSAIELLRSGRDALASAPPSASIISSARHAGNISIIGLAAASAGNISGTRGSGTSAAGSLETWSA